jgi:hypothetical protein
MKKVNYYNAEMKTMNYFTEGKEENVFGMNTEELNKHILTNFYNAVNWLLNKSYEEYIELNSNTINPAQQNAFLPLREYRVKRNGHYKLVNIYYRFFGGCWIEERTI